MLNLQPGALLEGYRVERAIGSGGFGVTYLVVDEALGKHFALKEYFPTDFAEREAGVTVRAKGGHVDDFLWGKERFIEEARILARFQHRNIVGVARIFSANNTAYIVEEYQSGRSLKDWLQGLDGPPTQDELDLLAAPLLSALETIHANDVLHRDIAPDNIYIRDDGSPVLLDFGSAKEAVAQRTRTVTSVVKTGYSPMEQYSTKGKGQGVWTDIYAFAATLYMAISGKAPPEATERLLGEACPPAAEVAKVFYRATFLEALDWGLKLTPNERPQSVQEWRGVLLGPDRTKAESAPLVVTDRPIVEARIVEAISSGAYSKPSGRTNVLICLMGAIVVAGVAALGAWRPNGNVYADARIVSYDDKTLCITALTRDKTRFEQSPGYADVREASKRGLSLSDCQNRLGYSASGQATPPKLASAAGTAVTAVHPRPDAAPSVAANRSAYADARIVSYDDKTLCITALTRDKTRFEQSPGYADHVREAAKRGLSLSDCQNRLGYSVH